MGKKKKNNDIILKCVYMSSRQKFGFCRPNDIQDDEKCAEFIKGLGKDRDIFISEKDIHNAFDGDIVSVKIKKNSGLVNKHYEGEITEIIKHSVDELVGKYVGSKNYGFVVPDNRRFKKDIYIKAENTNDAQTGDKVVVKIYDFGDEKRKPEGIVKEIIGKIGEKGVDISSIIKDYGIRNEFGEGIEKELDKIKDKVDEEDITEQRSDFRDKLTFTIDSVDARDLDDAISVYFDDENKLYEIGVHIADVSHYVRENSMIDIEAKLRGTSVYFPDRVVPMLPKKLSNGICSLNEGVDRLTLSCILYFDTEGKFNNYVITKSVINSNHRLNYTDTAKMLEGVDAVLDYGNDNNLLKALTVLKFITGILKEERRKRGSIDFNFPESKIILDDNGKCIDVKPYERNIATRIIEELMLKANEVIAQHYYFMEYPFVYRIHEKPDNEKIKRLANFIIKLGFTMKQKAGDAHPKEVQKLLSKIENHPLEMMINRVTLRSLKKAKYSSMCLGHFGLAAKYYTHFTSPIRRYPDLQIHRIISLDLEKKLDDEKLEHFNKILDNVCLIASEAENKAEKAENDSVKMKKCEYMQSKIGEVFEGVISDISSYGMYVELDNLIEGFIHVKTMSDDHYIIDEENYEIYGRSNGKTYKIGDRIKIKVSGVDRLMRTIDFELAKNR